MTCLIETAHPRIVVPIVAGIGNALMAQPMVRQLKRSIPGAHVTIVAKIAPMGAVFDRMPEVNEVRLLGRNVLGYFTTMVSLQVKRRPDVFLIPFPSNRWEYMALALASGARHRVLHGYSVGRLSALGIVPAARLPAVKGVHDVIQNLQLLRMLDIEPDLSDPGPRFAVNDVDRQRAGRLLQSVGVDADCRPIAMHAGSARTVLAAAKRWPTGNYGELIGSLKGRFTGRLVMLEGPDEAGVGEEIRRQIDVPVLRLTGPLGDVAGVLERSCLYVGSDSGLAHLAAAVGTPPVTLFGPADPGRVCPFGYRHLVIQPSRECIPCFLYPWKASKPKLQCGGGKCIREITVEAVMAVIERALGAVV